ncbi:MAG: NADH-dependent [FeFe] hydrogenase, group A6 [bacterium]
MATISMTIDGTRVDVESGSTILDACRTAGIALPTLCYLRDVAANASCGVCVVEVKGGRSLVRSCVTKVIPNMDVQTASTRVLTARKTAVELLLANHPMDCLSCIRNGSCELQAMAERLNVRQARFPATRKTVALDETSPSIIRDNNKCILCGRCVAVCKEVQSVSAIDIAGRGLRTHVGTFMDRGLKHSVCTNCGQCTVVCPTAAIVEKDETDEVFKALRDPSKVVVVQTAPAIRASIGEALGMEPGALVTGKMVTALRKLGFNRVFDTQFTADLTIMEEGTELLERLTKGGTLPMITSCSPGWISFIETFYPKLLKHLSSCKSPQQMFGSLAKSYYAEKVGIDPANMVVVSIMPCTAKKFEAHRPEMQSAAKWWKQKGRKGVDSFFDVDYVLTTRELARMIKNVGLDFTHLEEQQFDDPLGQSTGAAVIFGTTGGVMEAAVRTAYEVATGQPLPNINLTAVRGLEGIKHAELNVGGKILKVAVAHTLKNARALLEEIAAGKSEYAFIEVMTCPGGCIGGGGQPILPDREKREARAKSIYVEDTDMPLRKSHENPAVQALYKEFLEKPLSHISHELLHTHYAHHEV